MGLFMKTEIIQAIENCQNLYNRLILIVGSSYTGKTGILHIVGQETGLSILNVNLELAKKLLDMSRKQRMLKSSSILHEIIESNYKKDEVVLLDNTEILFDTELKIDPLKLLQDLARQHCIVATWNGAIENNSLIYGKIGHREYRKYSTEGLIIFTMDKIR